MTKAVPFLAALLAGSLACGAIAETPDSGTGKAPLPEQVTALRARGPEGLTEALRTYDLLEREQAQRMFSCSRPPTATDDNAGNLSAWRAAVDQIGGQRGCTVSRLYWYTDLEGAKAAAKSTGRPILSLRMLGKLTDEYSCANSRLFRTALYSNKEI